MTKYVQIIDGIVAAIVELESLPEYEFDGELRKVDLTKPIPELGWKYTNGKFIAPLLNIVKEEATNALNRESAQKRKNVSKAYWGMEIIYSEKVKDANAFAGANYPTDLSLFPWIAKEVEITGKDAKTVSNGIQNKNKKWLNTLMEIENIRFNGNCNIKKAKKPDVVNSELNVALSLLDDLL